MNGNYVGRVKYGWGGGKLSEKEWPYVETYKSDAISGFQRKAGKAAKGRGQRNDKR